MKASRGRLSIYQQLKTDEYISKHLLETTLFSKSKLFYFLKKYSSVIIKPAFGPSEISIFTINTQFKIVSETGELIAPNKEKVYDYLIQYKLKQTHYIIQPIKLYFHSQLSPFHYFITAHREAHSTEWTIVSKIKKYNFLFEQAHSELFIQKIHHLSILAAQKLSNSFPDCNTIVLEVVAIHESIWIQDIVLHLPISKWSQFHSLNTTTTLSPYIPVTKLLTQNTMFEFLNQFNEVIIKPCQGQQGTGIVQITKIDSATFEIHAGRSKQTKSSFAKTYQYIQKIYQSKKYYLIQPKLPLATINDCPMDVRILVQKSGKLWMITGEIVKVAAKNFIITNAAQKLLSIMNALQASNIAHLNKKMLISKIESICLTAAKVLENTKTGITIIGFDVGITLSGEIWIIEGNYQPDLSMFYRANDKTIYMNISKGSKSN